MKKNKLFWILTVICVLNFAAHLYFYPSLPDIVPTHWGCLLYTSPSPRDCS